MDLFEKKTIKPMLIGASSDPFDSDDYIFELKLDGLRCIAYLEPGKGTELRNKRDMKLLGRFPELSEIHKQVKQRCILDGELFVMNKGKPDFFALQRRAIMGNQFKISLYAQKLPATFTAFDILYIGHEQINMKPLL